MILRKYVFLTGLICFAVVMTQSSFVQASTVVEEIEKAVSPAEEVQIDEAVLQNLSEPQTKEREEQPADSEETQTEDEDIPQDTETDEEQPETNDEEPTKNEEVIQNTEAEGKLNVQNTEISTEPKHENISAVTPKTEEENSVETIANEESETEKESKIHDISLYISKLYNQISDFLSEWYEQIIAQRETNIQPSKPYDADVCCRQFPNNKPVTSPPKFVPYYFMYQESAKKYLERINFTNNINHYEELFPYIFTIKNAEIRYDIPKDAVTPQGITDIGFLMDAPSPKIEVMGKSMFAKLVIDVRNNTLYKYNENGFPIKAYLIATGARGNRTKTGLRIVTYKEKFPYRGAPKDCKRLTDPYSYGPYIIFMNAINPKTGRQIYVDQFLHGNGNEKSIGRKVSHGCMRTNNNVMRNELSKEVNRGDYVLIINPDIN